MSRRCASTRSSCQIKTHPFPASLQSRRSVQVLRLPEGQPLAHVPALPPRIDTSQVGSLFDAYVSELNTPPLVCFDAYVCLTLQDRLTAQHRSLRHQASVPSLPSPLPAPVTTTVGPAERPPTISPEQESPTDALKEVRPRVTRQDLSVRQYSTLQTVRLCVTRV
jgi:hypothetical protein